MAVQNDRYDRLVQLVTVEAEKKAKEFRRDRKLTTTQMRNFYNHLKNLQRQCVDESSFRKKLPFIKMTIAMVEYKSRSKSGKITREFAQFLRQGIEKVRTLEHFNDFMLYFEAVIGFSGDK